VFRDKWRARRRETIRSSTLTLEALRVREERKRTQSRPHN
jgi:hypothetical protein